MTKAEYAAYQEAVETFFAKEGIHNLSTGPLRCPECQGDLDCNACPEHGEITQEPYFSWSPCDCCGSSLGGNRMDASGYNPTTQGIQEYSICEDCEYYSEYGHLDDQTMWDIEHSAE